MTLNKTAQHIILERDEPMLRNIISTLATDFELGLTDYFNWFEEDNTGNIQICVSPSSVEELEVTFDSLNGQLTEDLIEVDDYERDDIVKIGEFQKLLREILTEQNNKTTFIEYGI